MWNSIVRRGNHFVRMPNTGDWVLIDGPWFNTLKHYSFDNGYFHPVRIPYSSPPEFKQFDPDDLPVSVEFRYLEWEAIRWHPGVGSCFMESYYRMRYKEYLNDRARIGFRILGGQWDGKDWRDGALPHYFSSALVIPWWWGERLLEEGY